MTDCLAVPTGVYPNEPAQPKAGEPITDTYLQALKAWANRILGIATEDRIAWRGERQCVRGLRDAGQIK